MAYLYDIWTDRRITDRGEIIDRLVTDAAYILTWSEREVVGEAGRGLLFEPKAERLLAEALTNKRWAWVVQRLVSVLWRSEVQAA